MAAAAWWIIALCLFLSVDQSKCSKAESNLYRDLLANYSSLVRPVRNSTQKLRVAVRFFLQQIVNVDEKNQVIELNAWLKYIWFDYRLKWKPEKYEDISSIRFSGADNIIFQPDVYLYNSADKSFDSTYKSNLVVYHTGEVNWIPPGIFRASCRLGAFSL
uniref:Neurotransmitter-gated ion-channel ligand-binding domain-containing protein n=1 Tax=Panagrolaimus sp. JU765 TaxID=591449 RepID=A0AC34PVK2_9BILA